MSFFLSSQFDPDFQTPLILGESLDLSDSEESQFVGAFSDGLWAKSEPILSMSAFQKPGAGAILDYGSAHSLHDAASYSAYGQSPYVSTPIVPSPMADQASQISDCVPYLPSNEYASSYEESQSPMIGARHRQLPEIVTYSPHHGREGTRVMVQIQSPYDLHSSSFAALYLVFGSKKCESLPTFLGFQGSAFQYGLSAEAPAFLSTGSPSFAVTLSVLMETQDDRPATSLQVGVYTYEQVSHPSPSGGNRKRKFSPYVDHQVAPSAKRHNGQVIPKVEHHEGYHSRNVSGSYSPYLQPLPAMAGFAAPFHAASSPQTGSGQYSSVATPQPTLRVPSPITPAWSPSFVSVSNDARNTGLALTHGIPQHKGHSQRGSALPTLIRTSTIQSNGMSHNTNFNPYAMYPTKAVLKLNGDLDSMAQGWSKEELVSQRRLVQFTRSQTGSTIQADFKAVTPEGRAPNSICISCISWEGKGGECYVTSVDTIYLLESLVAVRFTVEEKNRIRRNLEGFRPLTVSKAKADSEDFFKVIMGFPAPKPRNIEKDVKVFPWKVLAHALKKIIGKYSASYSSTAGALPTPMTTNYASHVSHASHGTGSDSGTEAHTANSPQSISDAGNTYATGLPAQNYTQANQSNPQLSSAPDLRSMIAVTQAYSNVGGYSFPAICPPQSVHGLSASAPRPAWELQSMAPTAPHTGAPTNGACYSYLDPVYSMHDGAHP